MLMSLSKNRPKEMDKEAFEKMWDNLGYSLSALYTTCQEMMRDLDTVKEDDFSIPNHYALLAFKAGKKEMLQTIINYLPDSAKNT